MSSRLLQVHLHLCNDMNAKENRQSRSCSGRFLLDLVGRFLSRRRGSKPSLLLLLLFLVRFLLLPRIEDKSDINISENLFVLVGHMDIPFKLPPLFIVLIRFGVLKYRTNSYYSFGSFYRYLFRDCWVVQYPIDYGSHDVRDFPSCGFPGGQKHLIGVSFSRS